MIYIFMIWFLLIFYPIFKSTEEEEHYHWFIWILFSLVWVIPSLTGVNINTGSGSQVGYVSAVERTGVLWKTGRLYIKPELESTQEDVYCVKDDELLKELEKTAETKSKIKVKHFSVVSAGVANCSSESAIVESFEVLSEVK